MTCDPRAAWLLWDFTPDAVAEVIQLRLTKAQLLEGLVSGGYNLADGNACGHRGGECRTSDDARFMGGVAPRAARRPRYTDLSTEPINDGRYFHRNSVGSRDCAPSRFGDHTG